MCRPCSIASWPKRGGSPTPRPGRSSCATATCSASRSLRTTSSPRASANKKCAASSRPTRFAEPLSLVLVDIDFFKAVNDELGHGAGDEALKELAQLIVTNSRSFSIVTRYGGDEFAVLLVNTPKAGAFKYAQRIKDVIEHHRFTHG